MKVLPLALLAFAACASPAPAPQESAEDLLNAVERRHLEAKSLRWTSETPIEGKGPDGKAMSIEMCTEAAFQGPDRFKLVMTAKGIQGFAMTVQCDGRTVRISGLPHGNHETSGPDAEKAGQALRRFFFRAGFVTATRASARGFELGKPEELDKLFPITEVRYGADGRVGDRDAKSIRYRLRPPGVLSLEVTLWVDPGTRELLRRDFRDFKGDVVSETFSRTDFAASFPDGHFDLPKDAK